MMNNDPNNSQHSTLQENMANHVVSPGNMLKQARLKSGLALEDISHRLHLTIQIIEDLENNHYQRIVALVFVKGYLRAYAKLLNLPVNEVMAAFEQLGIEEKEHRVVPEITFKPHREFTDKLVPWFLGTAILIVLTISLVWWRVEHKSPKEMASSALDIKQKPLMVTQADNQNMLMKGEPNPMQAIKAPPVVPALNPSVQIQKVAPTPVVSSGTSASGVQKPDVSSENISSAAQNDIDKKQSVRNQHPALAHSSDDTDGDSPF